MVSSRPHAEGSTSPSPLFLLAEGFWLVVLLAFVAPNHLPQWGKQLYQNVLSTSDLTPSMPRVSSSIWQHSQGVVRPTAPLASQTTAPTALHTNPPQIHPPASPALEMATPVQQPNWAPETIDYFLAVALSSEYGSSGSILKWQDELRIQVLGTPTAQDLQTLSAVTQELHQLTGLSITLVDQSPNVEIHFAPMVEFAQLEPNYKPGNEGFFWTWFENGVIDRAKILINSQQTERVRSHLLREELTQSLGLMNDSRHDPDSIFYQGWTQTNAFNPTDQAVIQMLYQPSIRPNMTRAEVLQALHRS
jgi:Protein of unknown function (DUF2927)